MKSYAAPKRRNIVHLLNRMRNAPAVIQGARRPGPTVEEYEDALLEEVPAPAEDAKGEPS